MKNLILIILVAILLNSCASKNENIKIDKKEAIYIKYTNNTDKQIVLKKKLEKLLKQKGFNLDFENRAKTIIDINIIFANETMRKSKTRSFLENVDLGVSVGHVFGNVGLSGKIGTKVKDLIGDKYDERVFEIVVEINIKDENRKILQYSSIVAQALLESKTHKEVIPKLENEIVVKIEKVLNN